MLQIQIIKTIFFQNELIVRSVGKPTVECQNMGVPEDTTRFALGDKVGVAGYNVEGFGDGWVLRAPLEGCCVPTRCTDWYCGALREHEVQDNSELVELKKPV